MTNPIRIATALIDDDAGRLFLVRKHGTTAFMQPGGKIEDGETPLEALARELAEELAFAPAPGTLSFIGVFQALAANEPDAVVEAHAFHVRCHGPFQVGAELEEGRWLTFDEASSLSLAPLTREWILPLARALHLDPQRRGAELLDVAATQT